MAGCIDDFENSLNQILRAAHLPVSVMIVKIGASQEENDSKKLRVLSEKSFAECERAYIEVCTYEGYKKNGALTHFLAQ